MGGRIAIATFARPAAYAALVRAGTRSHERWAAARGYELLRDVDDVYDASRPPHWSKLRLLLKHADSPRDWLMWLDADTIVVDQARRVEDILMDAGVGPEHEMLMTRDPRGSINTGVFFTRCTPWARAFLEAASARRVEHPDWQEQASIVSLYREDALGARRRIRIEHRTWKYNAYPREKNLLEGKRIPEIGIYRRGDFLVHCLGMTGERLRRTMDGFAAAEPSYPSTPRPAVSNDECAARWLSLYGEDRGIAHVPAPRRAEAAAASAV